MILVDANLLLYAYNADAPEHAASARWLQDLLSGPETVGFAWSTLWAFLRISTNARLWPKPKPVAEAFAAVRELLAQPGVVILSPGPRHAELLEKLVRLHRATGPLVTDAVLAALALENGATLASTDQDLSRFTDLHWVNPLG